MECCICFKSLFDEGHVPTLDKSKEAEASKKARLCKDTNGRAKDVQLCCAPCGHVFHCKCIYNWIERKNFKCPICMKDKVLKRSLRPLRLPTASPSSSKQQNNNCKMCDELKIRILNLKNEITNLEAANTVSRRRVFETTDTLNSLEAPYNQLKKDNRKLAASNLNEQAKINVLRERVTNLEAELTAARARASWFKFGW